MANTLKFKVINCKVVQGTMMVFDLAVGYQTGEKFTGVMDVKGCWLKRKKDGSSYFVSYPSKRRVDRDTGEAVKDDNGHDIDGNHVDLHFADEGGKRGPTTTAWEFRKWLIEEATKAFEAIKASGDSRSPAAGIAGGPPRADAPRPAARPAAPRPAEAPVATADGFEEDDDGFAF